MVGNNIGSESDLNQQIVKNPRSTILTDKAFFIKSTYKGLKK